MSGGLKEAGDTKIIYVGCSAPTQFFWARVTRGAQEAANNLGIQYQYLYPQTVWRRHRAEPDGRAGHRGPTGRHRRVRPGPECVTLGRPTRRRRGHRGRSDAAREHDHAVAVARSSRCRTSDRSARTSRLAASWRRTRRSVRLGRQVDRVYAESGRYDPGCALQESDRHGHGQGCDGPGSDRAE